jgi:hypothetical protein
MWIRLKQQNTQGGILAAANSFLLPLRLCEHSNTGTVSIPFLNTAAMGNCTMDDRFQKTSSILLQVSI